MTAVMRTSMFFTTALIFGMAWLPYSDAVDWPSYPTSVTEIQGQNATIIWRADISKYASGISWSYAKVTKDGVEVISITKPNSPVAEAAFISRRSDLDLVVVQNNTDIMITFIFANLNKSTDEGQYHVAITLSTFANDSPVSKTSLVINIPTAISSLSPDTVTVNETEHAKLVCIATGFPTPSINWTRIAGNDIIGTGSPYDTINPITFDDDKSCYTCIAYNGVYDAKTTNVCLNVQYKPRNATVSSDKILVCQNGTANLTCTSGPANPAPSSYEFYNNGVLVGTSASNVYEATATAGLPDVNKFVCVPRNLLGRSVENGSVEVTAKVTPTVRQTFGNTKTVVEGSNLTLACTASGTTPLNVTWTRTGSPDVVGPTFPITDIKRGDAGLYSCTVNNGAECPSNTATINVTVNYKPESTNLTYTPNNYHFCKGNQITLTCAANGKPVAKYSLYRNNQLVQGESTTGVFSNVPLNEKGDNTFTCVPNNTAGTGENKSIQVFVKEAPVIVTSPQPKTVVEGKSLTLFCNATGLPVPNITWTKIGGNTVGSGETFTIASVVRRDEGSYRCTAINGDECNNATVDALVTVNYPPENTVISTNKSDNTLLKGDNVKLYCASLSKPQLCNVTFYHGNNIIQSYYGSTCTGAEAASHVITSIDGCNLEEYSCKVENQYGQEESKINLTVKVSATLNTSLAADIVLVEGRSLDLNCTATGCPTPNVTWTKIGVSAALVSDTGFFIFHRFNSLSKTDTGNYKCSVDNGVVGSPVERTIYVNVTYKPYLTNLTSTLSNACVNDTVTLECTSDANPPVHEYRFYLNDELVYTSSSGVYQFNVPQAGNNTYKCEPVNTVGTGQNATVTIPTKAPPQITYVSPSNTFVGGANVVLMCNVTGSDPLNVTWSKDGVSLYPEGSSHIFASIGRGDEATYQCTAHNGNECPVATATSSVTVIYKPENTVCSTNKSSNVFLQGETVNLTCQSSAKPTQCNVLFSQGANLLANKSSSTCSASYLLTNIQGCNQERLSFYAQNAAGNGDTFFINIIVQVPPGVSVTPSSDTIAKEEGHPLSLNCTPTGCPSANVTWTKNGVSSPLEEGNGNTLVKSFTSLTKQDTGTYQCTVDNGVAGSPVSKTIYVNVTYKPYLTNLTSTLSNACVNDTVTLECASDANPPVHEYRFYLNDELVHTSSSGVYQFNVPQAGNNTYKCEPVNTVGSGENVTVRIATKVKVHNFIGPKNVSVNQSEQFNVVCSADGKPTSKLSLVFTNGLKITGVKALYIILTAYKNMSGKFNCTAENKVTPPQTKSAWLNVWYPTDRTICSNKTVLEGDDVRLVCSPNGNPPPDMMWIRNGIIRGRGRTLEIKSVVKSDYGIYTFLANNGLGYKRTSIFLTVQSRDRSPEIANPYKASLVVDEGRNASFLCNASGYPVPNITWSSNGVIISTQSKFIITTAKKYDTSCYTCKADNGVGEAKNVTICLTVLYPPSNTTIDIPGNRITVKEGESLILNCRSDSRPDATYTWKYNDVLLSSPQNRTLIVKRINRRQSGLYRCEAKNRLGSASSNTIEIVVQYLDSLTANGNINKSYSQSNPVIWFNLSVNAYPSNVSLSCKFSAPNILTVISNQNTRFRHAKQYLVIVIIKSVVNSGSIVCKAEHITGEREITLDFYRQTTVFREEFSGQFEITNQEWHDDLGKSESNRFKILKGKCTKIFKAAYDGITFLASIKIKEFLKGSVIVQFQLEVIKQVPDPLLPLKTYIKQNGGEIEGLRIDYSSIQKSKGLKPETRISQTENETIIAAVLGTLFVLSIVLNIILIAYLIWVRTKDSRRDSEKRSYNNKEMGQMDVITLQETNFNNPGMSKPNSELEYEPIGRRGLATSNPGISEYETVATGTRPTQPPSGADTSVPQYERVHHQGQPGAPSKHPSAIYRNIPGGQCGNYGSLSPSTRLPHQGTSQTGEYQALQRKVVSPQYQSLDDLSRC